MQASDVDVSVFLVIEPHLNELFNCFNLKIILPNHNGRMGCIENPVQCTIVSGIGDGDACRVIGIL